VFCGCGSFLLLLPVASLVSNAAKAVSGCSMTSGSCRPVPDVYFVAIKWTFNTLAGESNGSFRDHFTRTGFAKSGNTNTRFLCDSNDGFPIPERSLNSTQSKPLCRP
jgi:hypothetical protein